MEIDNQSRRTLQQDEVVSVQTAPAFLISHKTFKVDEFFSSMQRHFGKQEWFAGVECEVLAPGTGWQKGSVRICFEFCLQEPIIDEPVSDDSEIDHENDQHPDSPLDEIRLKIQNST
ncbi:hypothetical protein IFO70_33670 [Phormidium tenue FACHB-886]|nr:hypothetical protein [Phormidium tenue FACHB-886]